MLRTHITLTGADAVTAELHNDPETGRVWVALYLGAALVIELPPAVADAVGDALADVSSAVVGPVCYTPGL